jgi:3-(3-hydroxy-phenyl)propionate hydroxylase
MIDLSVLAGHVLAPPKRWQGTLRDGVSWLLNYVPPVKRYFLEMRFKPMPQYTRGALIAPNDKSSAVGKMFIQPRVLTEAGDTLLLDEVIGSNFAIIAWGCDPIWGMSRAQVEQWSALGTRFIQVLPDVQLKAASDVSPGVIRVGDSTGRLKEWFASGSASIALVRPDRFLAGLAIPQTVGQACDQLTLALKALPQTPATTVASQVA